MRKNKLLYENIDAKPTQEQKPSRQQLLYTLTKTKKQSMTGDAGNQEGFWWHKGEEEPGGEV